LKTGLEFSSCIEASHGVTSTPAGQSFLFHGRQVLQQLNSLCEDRNEYSREKGGHLRISATTTFTTEFLPGILSTYLKMRPEVKVDLRMQLSHDIVQSVSNGTADIEIVADTASTHDLEVKPYREYRYVVATSVTHFLADCNSVSSEETLNFDHFGSAEASAMHGFLMQSATNINRSLQI
jgi:DNA-binding transcriptional LysR family regulator